MSFVIIRPNYGFVTGHNNPFYTWNPTEAAYFDTEEDAEDELMDDEHVIDKIFMFKPLMGFGGMGLGGYLLWPCRFAMVRTGKGKTFAVFKTQRGINPPLHLEERVLEGTEKECLNEVKRRMKEEACARRI